MELEEAINALPYDFERIFFRRLLHNLSCCGASSNTAYSVANTGATTASSAGILHQGEQPPTGNISDGKKREEEKEEVYSRRHRPAILSGPRSVLTSDTALKYKLVERLVSQSLDCYVAQNCLQWSDPEREITSSVSAANNLSPGSLPISKDAPRLKQLDEDLKLRSSSWQHALKEMYASQRQKEQKKPTAGAVGPSPSPWSSSRKRQRDERKVNDPYYGTCSAAADTPQHTQEEQLSSCMGIVSHHFFQAETVNHFATTKCSSKASYPGAFMLREEEIESALLQGQIDPAYVPGKIVFRFANREISFLKRLYLKWKEEAEKWFESSSFPNLRAASSKTAPRGKPQQQPSPSPPAGNAASGRAVCSMTGGGPLKSFPSLWRDTIRSKVESVCLNFLQQRADNISSTAQFSGAELLERDLIDAILVLYTDEENDDDREDGGVGVPRSPVVESRGARPPSSPTVKGGSGSMTGAAGFLSTFMGNNNDGAPGLVSASSFSRCTASVEALLAIHTASWWSELQLTQRGEVSQCICPAEVEKKNLYEDDDINTGTNKNQVGDEKSISININVFVSFLRDTLLWKSFHDPSFLSILQAHFDDPRTTDTDGEKLDHPSTGDATTAEVLEGQVTSVSKATPSLAPPYREDDEAKVNAVSESVGYLGFDMAQMATELPPIQFEGDGVEERKGKKDREGVRDGPWPTHQMQCTAWREASGWDPIWVGIPNNAIVAEIKGIATIRPTTSRADVVSSRPRADNNEKPVVGRLRNTRTGNTTVNSHPLPPERHFYTTVLRPMQMCVYGPGPDRPLACERYFGLGVVNWSSRSNLNSVDSSTSF